MKWWEFYAQLSMYVFVIALICVHSRREDLMRALKRKLAQWALKQMTVDAELEFRYRHRVWRLHSLAYRQDMHAPEELVLHFRPPLSFLGFTDDCPAD